MKIWKYKLDGIADQDLKLPAGAAILSVQWQFAGLSVWAMVDETLDVGEIRKIEIYGTGWPIENPEFLRHLGTAQASDFVWHVFERV